METPTFNKYTPASIQALEASADKTSADLSTLAKNNEGIIKQGDPSKFSFATSTPPVIEATDIGTEAITPTIPNLTTTIEDQLADIQNQALSVQDQVSAFGEQEKATVQTQEDQSLSGKLDPIIKNYEQMLTGGFQLSDEARALQDEATASKARVSALSAQIAAYDKNTKDQIYAMSKNPLGKSMGANAASIKNFEYERYARPGGAADMAIELMAQTGYMEAAVEYANNAVSAEREQYNTQLDGLSTLFTMTQNDMTASESMQFQSQLRMYENQVTSMLESKEVAVQRAAQAGASVEVLTAIKNAKSASEVWEAAGIYGEDPELKLQWDRFDWEKQKYWADRALSEQIRNNEIALSDALDIQVRNNSLYEAGNYKTYITDLEDNLAGLFQSTGTSALGRFAPFSADKKRFLATANYVLNNETFKKLAEITANTSLGAISEGELKLVEEAATRLGSFAIRDKDGSLTGFDGSHEDVLAAIIELEDAQNRYMDKLRIGALSPEEYASIGGTLTATVQDTPLKRAERKLEEGVRSPFSEQKLY